MLGGALFSLELSSHLRQKLQVTFGFFLTKRVFHRFAIASGVDRIHDSQGAANTESKAHKEPDDADSKEIHFKPQRLWSEWFAECLLRSRQDLADSLQSSGVRE